MKTRMKTLAAGTILALLIIGGNVQAKGTEVKTTFSKTEENTLELENWMLSDRVWNSNKYARIAVENDESLQLEGWMTDTQTWNKINQKKQPVKQDLKLELENWMINTDIWEK